MLDLLINKYNILGGLFSASDLTGLDPSSFVRCRLSSKTLNVDGFQARAVLLASSGWGCEFTCVSSPGMVNDSSATLYLPICYIDIYL